MGSDVFWRAMVSPFKEMILFVGPWLCAVVVVVRCGCVRWLRIVDVCCKCVFVAVCCGCFCVVVFVIACLWVCLGLCVWLCDCTCLLLSSPT